MIVPAPGIVDEKQVPKLIGHLDLYAGERQARYMKIGGAVFGAAVVFAIVCALYFHNKWERDNRDHLLSLKRDADALVQAKEYEKAKAKYDELFSLLGDQVLASEDLKAAMESAHVAATENDKKVEDILVARADIERKRQEADQQRQEAASLAIAAQPPSDPPAGMTYENYIKIEDGMSSLRVELLLNSFEPEEQGSAGSLRTLMWKRDDGALIVCTFDDDHLISKSQTGLE